MCLPDPVELLEARQDRLASEWEEAQEGVPEGSFRCPYCRQVFDYEPIQASGAPDSPMMCFECLPEHVKSMFNEFISWVEENLPELTGLDDGGARA